MFGLDLSAENLLEAARRFWEHGDPSGRGEGWWGIVILLIWAIPLTGLPIYLAKRWHGTREYLSATMGVIAVLSIGWWVYGILPSAFVAFLDNNGEALSGKLIPASFVITVREGYVIEVATNLYNVIRDLVVVVEHFAAFALTFWGALMLQRDGATVTEWLKQRKPGADKEARQRLGYGLARGLVAGETKPEGGGYK